MEGTELLYFEKGINLLKKLITTPSFSNEESEVADIWEDWLRNEGIKNVKRFHNNVYAVSASFDPKKPILLLNSHMDTVRPVSSYTKDPFSPILEDNSLYGLGSNDAGGAGVSLATTFIQNMDNIELPVNLLLAITASEEKMGELGMRAFLPHLKDKGLYPHFAIVGEPTECKAAIAEKGLVVCDVIVKGKSGHAARNEGINAIYKACSDIERIRTFSFPKMSETLGHVKVSVTMIDSGTQHNVVPDKCHYVVDIRTTDSYTNEKTVDILRSVTEWSEFVPRSTRIRASVLPKDNPLFKTAQKMGLETFVSPTTSDMALMHDIPSIKIGPGKSERSHTADEFIKFDEIKEGMLTYQRFIDTLKL